MGTGNRSRFRRQIITEALREYIVRRMGNAATLEEAAKRHLDTHPSEDPETVRAAFIFSVAEAKAMANRLSGELKDQAEAEWTALVRAGEVNAVAGDEAQLDALEERLGEAAALAMQVIMQARSTMPPNLPDQKP